MIWINEQYAHFGSKVISVTEREGDDPDELVLTMRKAYQSTMRHDLISGIEEILERKVLAYERQPHRPRRRRRGVCALANCCRRARQRRSRRRKDPAAGL